MTAVSAGEGGLPLGRWRWLLARLFHDRNTSGLKGRPSGATSEEIDALYRHRRLDLVRLAVLLVDDIPTAEDVVQEAFAALYRRHNSTLDSIADPEAYVRRSVVNTARDVLRRRRTVRAYIPPRILPAPPPEDEILLKEEHQEVLRALRLLTVRQREVLVLRYWSDLSEADIAAALDLSRGAVKSTASRALKALAKRLKETS
ncbi:SigE family RNA polymerase sigma factor [Streptomyces sp. NPDC059134]|uniref:SigE family RNA polymerase sigma factor n=1 Tax=Streptomyces sp. NPDC059134 TaxID=3346738 RepID=UPI003688A850